ncbi:MAG: hypothetical protein U9N44_06070, partial [Chloroflexota bacterium]|nr:hypothetical protein [Chloroflexota bacterium]
GGSSDSFSILNAGVNANTRDTIALNYGTGGTAALSFSTNDTQKQFSIEIASADEDDDNANETLYKVMNTSISSGSKAIFSMDHAANSLLYTNYGNTSVTYSVQILNVAYPLEDAGTSLKADGVEVYTSGLSLGSLGAVSTLTENEDDEEYPASMDEEIQTSPVYTFTIDPMETHIISPDDWSNLPEAEIDVEVEECGDGVCGEYENHICCPADCPSGSADGYCDGASDGKCDPDCIVGTDPDCKESTVMSLPVMGGVIGALVMILAIIIAIMLRKNGGSKKAGT